MEYLIGSRNGGCPDPFDTLESANAAAKEMSIADPTEWFDVINEDAEVLYAWHDGKAYNPVDEDEYTDVESSPISTETKDGTLIIRGWGKPSDVYGDDSDLADMYPLEID